MNNSFEYITSLEYRLKAANSKIAAFESGEKYIQMKSEQVIAKLAKLVRNIELKQGRIRAKHESWNKKWVTGHFRRTLISPRLYGVGKSQAMKDFKLLMYCR